MLMFLILVLLFVSYFTVNSVDKLYYKVLTMSILSLVTLMLFLHIGACFDGGINFFFLLTNVIN